MSSAWLPKPRTQLATVWYRRCEMKDKRDRYQAQLEAAEERFAELAEQQGLTWAEAVEIATERQAA